MTVPIHSTTAITTNAIHQVTPASVAETDTTQTIATPTATIAEPFRGRRGRVPNGTTRLSAYDETTDTRPNAPTTTNQLNTRTPKPESRDPGSLAKLLFPQRLLGGSTSSV
jgi:hypothetical protein